MTRSVVRTLGLSLCALGAQTVAAVAQCPDGTPPPCRGSTPPAGPRRIAPPLDERTWIVVPFENVARVQDIEWLKDASVKLLYLDMSKWRDIRVIDDERVADLIREVPEARGGVQLTLQSGLAVARRAGAGRLVMGDLLKVGTRTQIVGKVFDVKSGQRMRTVRQEAANADSIMAAFASRDEPDLGMSLAGAFGHLVLADTVGAIARLRMFRDVTWLHSPIQDQLSAGFTFAGMLWPRTLLLLGDLAAATGDRATAIDAYRRFVDMWQNADAELQPIVLRARAALTKLGG